jgi:hypothetical protein
MMTYPKPPTSLPASDPNFLSDRCFRLLSMSKLLTSSSATGSQPISSCTSPCRQSRLLQGHQHSMLF